MQRGWLVSNVKDLMKRAEAFKSPWDSDYVPECGWKVLICT